MKRILVLSLIVFFGIVNFGYAQTAKDTYKAIKKAEFKASGSKADAESSLADARTEFDLFKDSKEAKKNPEFTAHLENAIKGLMEAGFANYVSRQGVRPKISYADAISKVSRELEAAKQYLK